MKRRDIIKLGGIVWIAPLVESVTLPAHAQTSPVIDPRDIDPEDPPEDDPEVPVCPDEWNKSSFKFDRTIPRVCNTGDGESLCPVRYQILISPPTKPARYKIVEESTIPPLGRGCYDFTSHLPDGIYRYCVRVLQDEGHPGTGLLLFCSETKRPPK